MRSRPSAGHTTNCLINQAKKEFHMNQFENCDSRELFQKVNRISKPSSAGVLPSINDSDEQVAGCFSKFFAERIEKIASEFEFEFEFIFIFHISQNRKTYTKRIRG